MSPSEEMWSSPHQSAGSDSVRHGHRGSILPAGRSAALHRLLSGPLTFVASDHEKTNNAFQWDLSFLVDNEYCKEYFISAGAIYNIIIFYCLSNLGLQFILSYT